MPNITLRLLIALRKSFTALVRKSTSKYLKDTLSEYFFKLFHYNDFIFLNSINFVEIYVKSHT